MSVAPRAAHTTWWVVLTVALAAGELLIGLAGPLPQLRWPALTGGVLVLVALAAAARWYRAAVVALVAGAVVPTLTTWWSLVEPLTAVLVLGCGVPALRSLRSRGARPEGSAIAARPAQAPGTVQARRTVDARGGA